MKKNWVEFKQLKEAVRFADVLAQFKIPVQPGKGAELVERCPSHEDAGPSFRVNTEKNVVHCF